MIIQVIGLFRVIAFFRIAERRVSQNLPGGIPKSALEISGETPVRTLEKTSEGIQNIPREESQKELLERYKEVFIRNLRRNSRTDFLEESWKESWKRFP